MSDYGLTGLGRDDSGGGMRRVPSPLLLSLLLLGCAPEVVDVPSAPANTHVERLASAPSLIVFDRAFTTPLPSTPPVRGGQVRVQFDRMRFYDIVDGEHSLGYFSTTFHCYGYGCCEVTVPQAYLHYRFDSGAFTHVALDAQDGADIAVPSDAGALEIYFDVPGFSVRTWYCGCDTQCAQDNYDRSSGSFHAHAAYDSDFGANYVFALEDGAPPAPAVALVADGQWQSNWDAPSGVRYGWFWDANVWIDVAVENLAFHKTVGVRWTVDGWASHHDTLATYEHDLGDGFEQWGVDLVAERLQSCSWCTPDPVTFEYAVFYEVDGQTLWDNNGGDNHTIALDTEYH
jgi:hypothetical protein